MSNTQTLTIAPAGTWELDAVHSSVGFEVEYMGGTFKGGFREVAATLVVGDDAVSLQGSAKVASIDVKDENLAGPLQSQDFLDAERYPTVQFTAKDISLDGETVKVDGDLTIKGVTREVTVEATVQGTGEDPWGNQRAGIAVRGSIDRTDFDLTWQSRLAGGGLLVGEEVNLLLDLSAVAS